MGRKLRTYLSSAFLLVLISFIAALTGGCDGPKTPSDFEAWMTESGKLKVLSTTAMVNDLVKEIGKERVDPLVLIVGEIDPHSYELVKGDDEKLSHAAIVFCSGLGLEHGASLRYQLQHHLCTIALGDKIQEEHPESILKVNGQIDPHIWMDISLWKEAIGPIVEVFSKMDPSYAAFYQENGQALRRQMELAHQKMLEQLQMIPEEKRFLVTSHDAFNYFARAYLATPSERKDNTWQKRFAAPEGLAPDGQLSTTDIQKMIEHLRTYKITVLFPESNVSKDSLKKIVSSCKEIGWTVTISPDVLYGDAMGSIGSDADSYLKMMQHNQDALINAWHNHG